MTVMNVLTKDRLQRKLAAYGQVFEKTDRIVSGKKLNVLVRDDAIPSGFAQVAGWTDGEDISLNGALLLEQLADKGRDQDRVIAMVKGVNYHELAHCLFTPRIKLEKGDKPTLSTKVQKESEKQKDPMVWHAFNILEDQRAETLFVAKYRPSRHYFQAIALEYLLNDPALVPSQYPLIHHRLWIPSDTRSGIARMYDQRVGKKGHAQEVGRVIDDYVRLKFPKDNKQGLALVLEFRDLLKEDSLSQRVSPDNHSGGGVVVKGDLQPGEQEKASKKIDDMIADLSDLDEDAQGGDGEEEDDTEAVGGAEPKGDYQESGPSMDDITEILEEISEALDTLMEDEDFVDDITTTQEAVKDAEANIPGGVGKGRGGILNWVSKKPDVADTSAVQRILKDLESLRFELTGTWEHHTPSGKVNPYDFYTADAGELDFFDRWIEGVEDQGGFEVVMLVDRSSSMNSASMDQACRVSWVLKRALEEVDGEVTVMTYTDRTYHMLDQPTEKADKNVVRVARSEGGTNPKEAIYEAARLLDRSEKPNKLVVNVTDGGWGDVQVCDKAVLELNAMGIHTALVGLNGAVSQYGDHNHQVAVDVRDISQISVFVEQLVANVLKQILLRT